MSKRSEMILGLARRQYDESGVHGRLVQLAARKHGKVSKDNENADDGIYGEKLEWETNWRIGGKKRHITLRHKKHTISVVANGNDILGQKLTVEGKRKVQVGRFGDGSNKSEVSTAIRRAMRHPKTSTARSLDEQKKIHHRIALGAEFAQYGLAALGIFAGVAALWTETRLYLGAQPWIIPHSPRIDVPLGTLPFHVTKFALGDLTPPDIKLHAWLSAESGIDSGVSLLSYTGIRTIDGWLKRDQREMYRRSIKF